ncbi:hypothetical protein [Stratiformator vulcanicus]|uniref:hypothetical protein n=1 Tax=Stratiformator vulcanicus TaxID=2527980 RepID=UPI0035C6953D
MRQGVSQQTAMSWMGHHDPAMTQHYFHLHHKDAAREISKLEPLALDPVEQPNTVGGGSCASFKWRSTISSVIGKSRMILRS